jgi:hypothetical protein
MATTEPAVAPSEISYTSGWAGYLLESFLHAKYYADSHHLDNVPSYIADQTSGYVKNRELTVVPPDTFFNEAAPQADPELHVAIIGAGVAGLFSALIFDEIEKKIPGFKVHYDIFEGSDRIGGRLYTHNFSKDPNSAEYYDIGAMRFPQVATMDR